MKRFIGKVRDSHDLIYKWFLFIVSIAFIVFLFPKEVKFKYEYQKQKPWLYDNLIAPFDIPVLKSENQIQRELDSLSLEQQSYYRWDTEAKDKAFDAYRSILDSEWDSIYVKNLSWFNVKKGDAFEEKKNRSKQDHIRFGRSLLNSVFQKGVMSFSDRFDRIEEDGIVRVLKGNVELEYIKSDFLSSKTAFDWVNESLNNQKNLNTRYLSDLMSRVFNIHPSNVYFDEEWTNKMVAQSEGDFNKVEGIIEKGELIILKGERINDEKFRWLSSFEKKHIERSKSSVDQYWIILGQTLLVALMIFGLALYLFYFRKEIFEFNKNLVFILLQVNFTVFFTYLVVSLGWSVYLLPFCLVPMVVKAFFDARTALFAHISGIIIVAFLVPNSYEFVFVQFIAGIGAIYGFDNLRKRAQLFITSTIVFACYALTYLGFAILQEGNITSIEWMDFVWLAAGAGLTLFAYPIIYVYEKAFGIVSDLTLLELADTNSPLLRELSLKAPGTFQHSLQVANLAEEAIHHIGGNPLLIRTGALYHDIGKTITPRYFIENQGGGVNPHDELSYQESAEIIIGHVHEGIKLAKKNRLPDQIIDFIRTHHGTSMTQYFYRMSLKDLDEDEIEKDLFTYPGPIPFSKETAILMMADSVEAASRSLKEYNAENISKLVSSIIDSQMNEGQFANADITMRDFAQIKKLFTKMLMNIYHVRVEYPR